MVLGPTHTVTEMSTTDVSWGGGKGDRCVKLTILTPSCVDCLEILEASTSWNPQGLSRPLQSLLVNSVIIYARYSIKQATIQKLYSRVIGTALDVHHVLLLLV